jgi:hypothetical protein
VVESSSAIGVQHGLDLFGVTAGGVAELVCVLRLRQRRDRLRPWRALPPGTLPIRLRQAVVDEGQQVLVERPVVAGQAAVQQRARGAGERVDQDAEAPPRQTAP